MTLAQSYKSYTLKSTDLALKVRTLSLQLWSTFLIIATDEGAA